MNGSRSRASRPFLGWILYDARCPFCSRWVHMWKPLLVDRGFDISPLNAKWVRERVKIPLDKLSTDLRLLGRDGSLVTGSDVYLHVARSFPWGWPLSMLFDAPGANWLLRKGYRGFADDRTCVARACGAERRESRWIERFLGRLVWALVVPLVTMVYGERNPIIERADSQNRLSLTRLPVGEE